MQLSDLASHRSRFTSAGVLVPFTHATLAEPFNEDESSQMRRKDHFSCEVNDIFPRSVQPKRPCFAPPPPPPQGVDSQYIKYSKEESRFVIDPCLRLARSQREVASEILEMGWLFITVMEYIEKIESKKRLDF